MPDYRSSPLRDQLSALLAEGERVLPPRRDPLGTAQSERTDKGFRVELATTVRLAEDDDEGSGVTTTDGDSGEPAKLYIYSDIGGWWGVWPEEIVAALADIGPRDVELHLHSPGGDAFDGVAIYNALRDHPGKIFGRVDGLCASAASVIAMASDELEMRRGGQLMIHDAWGLSVGNAEDMAKMVKFLDKVSDATAAIYAARAGGTAEQWRTAMKEESWYTDREAVEAGLADTMETSEAAAKSHWNLKVFQYAGREAAPDPLFPGGRWQLGTWGSKMARSEPGKPPATGTGGRPLVDMAALQRFADEEKAQRQPGGMIPAAQAAVQMHQAAIRARVRQAAQSAPDADPAAGLSETEGASAMPVDRAKIREALGLGPDATDTEVTAAYAAAFGAAPAPNPAPEQGNPTPAPAAQPGALTGLAAQAKALGVVLIDPSQLEQMRVMAEQGRMAYQKQRRDERDSHIQRALDEGRIELSRKEHWQKAWDADPEGARNMLDGLAPNMVPMQAAGYAGTVASNEAEQRLFDLYPEMKNSGVRRG